MSNIPKIPTLPTYKPIELKDIVAAYTREKQKDVSSVEIVVGDDNNPEFKATISLKSRKFTVKLKRKIMSEHEKALILEGFNIVARR